jgi:UDP-N-acetylmuramoyl-tripeptide--D-alanyl-D-alanine ligase
VNELRLTLGGLADAVRGRIQAGQRDRVIGNVVTDSRTLERGDFFVALRGPRFDGRAFVADAFARGASGAMVSKAFDLSEVSTHDVGIVEVADTTKALQDLAHVVRMAAETRVVAITGSTGKTTTKETIAAFLSTRLRVVKNKGNLNNHIGLPLSLLQLRNRPDVAVMELGMNHVGEISTLVAIAEPDVRVWTNVGDAHLGFFASADAVADAKAEILERADRHDVLVCNADDQRVMARVGGFVGKTITFGTAASADVRARDIHDLGIEGMQARVMTTSGSQDLRTQLLGRGNLANVLAASAVALEFGIPLDHVVSIVAGLRAADRRGVVHRLSRDVTLIDDSYNSSPAALRSALDIVAHVSGASRRIAVLGEMLELGTHGIALHEECGRLAVAAGVDLLVAIGGPAARALARAAVSAGMPPESASYFGTSAQALEPVVGLLRPGDLVLVKGSRGTRTDLVADRIMAEFG